MPVLFLRRLYYFIARYVDVHERLLHFTRSMLHSTCTLPCISMFLYRVLLYFTHLFITLLFRFSTLRFTLILIENCFENSFWAFFNVVFMKKKIKHMSKRSNIQTLPGTVCLLYTSDAADE